MKRRLLLAASALVLAAGCGPKSAPQAAAPVAPSPVAVASPKAPAAVSFASLAPVDVAPLNADITADALSAACAKAQTDTDATLAKIVAIPDGQRTFANSFVALDGALADFYDVSTRLSFLKDIHPDETVRKAAAQCEEDSGKYAVKTGSRVDLYKAMKGYLDHAGKTENLSAEDKRLIELTMRDFHHNGLDLPDDQRAKLTDLRAKLAELQTQFSAKLDDAEKTTPFSKAELAGLPDSFFAHLKKAPNGKYLVTTSYPDYYPVLESCKNAETRRKEQVAFMGRNFEATGLLDQAVELRAQAAHLLGYKTHADFVTEDRMAKNASNVASFLDKLQGDVSARLGQETDKMKALKSAETHEKNPTIYSWDWRYYENQIKKRDYSIDDEQVRAYFPADKVLAGMFDVYQKVLGVKFTEIPMAKPWADGVKLYEVHDAATGRLFAKFFVDLYPRKGKYGHAASFPITPAHLSSDGKGYQIPLTGLVVNFNPPANGQVAHLSIDEVDTLFHEFGHVMHGSLTTALYAEMSGSNVATDFVEAPSQMFENWVFTPEVLALVSDDGHGNPIPADLVQKIVRARKYDAGTHYMRQLFIAKFDQSIHTVDHADSDKVCRDLWETMMKFPEDKGEHFATSFGHLMGGYDAGYYGYLWSEVFADDMFTPFEKEGVLSPAVGKRLRDTILSQGRIEDPDVLLRNYLGREPNDEAFLRITGIKSQS